MKHCIDGNGNDSTSFLVSYLTRRQPIWIADLYQIRPPRSASTPFSTTILLTDWSSSLIWSYVGKFITAKISHSPIDTVVGLESQEISIDWAIGNSMIIYASNGTTPLESYYTAFREGMFDHGLVRIWRTFMPNPGNSNAFGSVMLFQGRIGDVDTDSLGVHIKAPNVMEVFNRKIPPNLIENANINAAWLLATDPTTMVVQTGSTQQLLLAQVQGSPGTIFQPGKFRYGYVYFTTPASSGELAGHYRQIQDSFPDNNGNNVLQLFEPLPFPPNVNASLGLASPGEVFQAYAPHPQNLSANNPSNPGYPQYMGFQFVPRPEDTI